MPKLEVFFDYTCPFCLLGHDSLTELLPQHPGIDVEWRPCEVHPRPETYGWHSDLCARGMYFALESGTDLMEYHNRMYRAAQEDCADIEDLSVLAEYMEGFLDPGKWELALSGGQYEDKLSENNRLAWDVYDFPALPSCCMDGDVLESIPGVGVSRDRLAAFMRRQDKSEK